LLARAFDKETILKKRLPYERLDQLTVDLLLGVDKKPQPAFLNRFQTDVGKTNNDATGSDRRAHPTGTSCSRRYCHRCFLFCSRLSIGWYLKGRANTGEDFFMAGREIRRGWLASVFFRLNLGALELMVGRVRLPVRHSRTLVLDRRPSGDAFPRAGHDAVLYISQNPSVPGIFKTAIR